MLSDGGFRRNRWRVPQIDTSRNLAMYRALTTAMRQSLVRSAHDCSDGGLAPALAECCFGADSGAEVDVAPLWRDCDTLDKWGALFGESLGRILVSVRESDRTAFEETMAGHACHHLGTVSEGALSHSPGEQILLTASMGDLRDAWKGALDGGAV